MPPSHPCTDHSGLIMWIKINSAVLTVAATVFSYSVIWQAPSLRELIAKEVARLETQAKDADRTIMREIDDCKFRISKLEGP